jgi:hypothetical protein
VHSSYRDGEALVGEAAQEARRCRSPRRGPEGFDEKYLQQASQDDLTRGPPLAGLLSHELNEGTEPLLAANVHESREERNEERRIRGTEGAIADQHANVMLAALNAVSEFAIGQRDGQRVDVRRRRLEAGRREVARRRDQNEVARLERHRLVAGGRETARTFEDHAVEEAARPPSGERATGLGR